MKKRRRGISHAATEEFLVHYIIVVTVVPAVSPLRVSDRELRRSRPISLFVACAKRETVLGLQREKRAFTRLNHYANMNVIPATNRPLYISDEAFGRTHGADQHAEPTRIMQSNTGCMMQVGSASSFLTGVGAKASLDLQRGWIVAGTMFGLANTLPALSALFFLTPGATLSFFSGKHRKER